MIDVTKDFVLYADCVVSYDGRASSTLARGSYLIVHKSDHSIQIHNSIGIPPVNYSRSNSRITYTNGVLTAKCHKEVIIITIYDIISLTYLDNWSSQDITIAKTEKELVNKLVANWAQYFQGDFVAIHREYPTKLGLVDLLGVERNGTNHVVEVKRRAININNCSQLKRYLECFDNAIGYLAAPDIGKNAMGYLKREGLRWVQVDFD